MLGGRPGLGAGAFGGRLLPDGRLRRGAAARQQARANARHPGSPPPLDPAPRPQRPDEGKPDADKGDDHDEMDLQHQVGWTRI
jgi:hypothetical protein